MPYRHLPDVQSEPDDRNVPLDRAGIKDLLWPITVQDRKHGKQTTVAKVSMFVNLPHNYRGTHMSRFVEVLNEYRGREWIDLTGDILSTLRGSLEADEAHMEVEFPLLYGKSVTGDRHREPHVLSLPFQGILPEWPQSGNERGGAGDHRLSMLAGDFRVRRT